MTIHMKSAFTCKWNEQKCSSINYAWSWMALSPAAISIVPPSGMRINKGFKNTHNIIIHLKSPRDKQDEMISK